MYLVLSAFKSVPLSLLATTKASAFIFIVCLLPPNIQHHQYEPEIDVYHLISSPPGLPETS